MREIKTIDIALTKDVPFTPGHGIDIKVHGTAYYRITPEFRDFLLKCEKVHKIAGFEWDGESLNFGVILKEQKNLIPPTRSVSDGR